MQLTDIATYWYGGGLQGGQERGFGPSARALHRYRGLAVALHLCTWCALLRAVLLQPCSSPHSPHCDVSAAVYPALICHLLFQGCRAVACMIPYRVGWAIAGRGSPAELWQESAEPCAPGAPAHDADAQAAADCSSLSADGAGGALLPGGVLAHAHGAEVMPDEEASRCTFLLASPVRVHRRHQSSMRGPWLHVNCLKQ